MRFSLENFGLQNIKTNCPSSLYLASTDEKPSPYDTGIDRTNSPQSMRHQGITMKDIKNSHSLSNCRCLMRRFWQFFSVMKIYLEVQVSISLDVCLDLLTCEFYRISIITWKITQKDGGKEAVVKMRIWWYFDILLFISQKT